MAEAVSSAIKAGLESVHHLLAGDFRRQKIEIALNEAICKAIRQDLGEEASDADGEYAGTIIEQTAVSQALATHHALRAREPENRKRRAEQTDLMDTPREASPTASQSALEEPLFRSQCNSTLAYFFEGKAMERATASAQVKTCAELTEEHVELQDSSDNLPCLALNELSVAAIANKYLGHEGPLSLVPDTNTKCSICHQLGHYEIECGKLPPHQLVHFAQIHAQSNNPPTKLGDEDDFGGEIDLEQCGAFFVESSALTTHFVARPPVLEGDADVVEGFHILEGKAPGRVRSVTTQKLFPGDFVAWHENPRVKERCVCVGTVVELAEDDKTALVQYLFRINADIEYHSETLGKPEPGTREWLKLEHLYLIDESVSFNAEELRCAQKARTA